ncbi:MAG TPA: hypothetical protein VK178_13910 [Opitutaceae bacterium]|nr:hypothetical protein [Opitutaceae bacterium]
MSGILAFSVFIGFTLLIIVSAFALGRRQAEKARENLAALARELGLRLEEKPPLLGVLPQVPTASGHVGGRAIRFHTYTTGSGKHRQTWQALAIACDNSHGLILQLAAQNFLTALGVKLGMQDVKVGDPVFDERFVLKTSDPDFASAALLPEIRAGLLADWSPRAMGAHVKIEARELIYAELGSFSDPMVTARMKALLEPLLALAALPEVYRK